jgi:hypothetical protein
MRTTISLDDELLGEAKERAARAGRTLSQVVEDALRESFLRHDQAIRKPVKLPLSTSRGGPRPGVDLNNNAALLDLMESEDD